MNSVTRKDFLHTATPRAHSKKRTESFAAETFEGITLLGTTAYHAFSESRAAATEPAAFSDFVPTGSQSRRLNMLNDGLALAMYSVARAGSMDARRRRSIAAMVSHIGLRDVDSGTLISILQFDPDPTLIAAMTRNAGERMTVYLASVIAADIDCDRERRYLEALQAVLEIPATAVSHLQRRALQLRERLDHSSYFGYPIEHCEGSTVRYDQAS